MHGSLRSCLLRVTQRVRSDTVPSPMLVLLDCAPNKPEKITVYNNRLQYIKIPCICSLCLSTFCGRHLIAIRRMCTIWQCCPISKSTIPRYIAQCPRSNSTLSVVSNGNWHLNAMWSHPDVCVLKTDLLAYSTFRLWTLRMDKLKKCNLTLAMSPNCHSNNAFIICWHE